jgi:hypothetical protein
MPFQRAIDNEECAAFAEPLQHEVNRREASSYNRRDRDTCYNIPNTNYIKPYIYLVCAQNVRNIRGPGAVLGRSWGMLGRPGGYDGVVAVGMGGSIKGRKQTAHVSLAVSLALKTEHESAKGADDFGKLCQQVRRVHQTLHPSI